MADERWVYEDNYRQWLSVTVPQVMIGLACLRLS